MLIRKYCHILILLVILPFLSSINEVTTSYQKIKYDIEKTIYHFENIINKKGESQLSDYNDLFISGSEFELHAEQNELLGTERLPCQMDKDCSSNLANPSYFLNHLRSENGPFFTGKINKVSNMKIYIYNNYELNQNVIEDNPYYDYLHVDTLIYVDKNTIVEAIFHISLSKNNDEDYLKILNIIINGKNLNQWLSSCTEKLNREIKNKKR